MRDPAHVAAPATTDAVALFEVLDDLEAQAGTAHHLERVTEVDDRSRAEYRSVLLEGRLMASVGRPVRLRLAGVGPVEGVLERVGDRWCQLAGPRLRWVVAADAVLTARGLSERAVPRVAWSPLDTVGLASPLRRAGEARTACVLHLLDGGSVEGRVLRVGGDFVELAEAAEAGGGRAVVPWAAVAAVAIALD